MLHIFKSNIDECEKENFRKAYVLDNIHRGKILAVTMIIFECVLACSDIITSLLKVDKRFHFNSYFIMYSIMICINVIYLLFITKFEKTKNHSKDHFQAMEMGMVVYLTLIMSWGSVVSLMDQKLYGQLIVFMIIMVIASVLYILDNKKIWIPYVFSVLILLIGLPFFQSSKDILIGHYVNISVFIIISWVASRIIYFSYAHDFHNRSLLQTSKTMLEQEIQEKGELNNALAMANHQLKKLALIDELTGIPNRRGFRNYIDIAFETYNEKGFTLSIVMVDIDFFKQYNDRYGHEAGDKALIASARVVNSIAKNLDNFFCRWGGEEFIYAAINMDEKDIEELAESIRQRVYEHKISTELDPVTVSIGTSTIQISDRDDVSRVMKLADQALYAAKNSGRNCVRNMCEESDS